MIVGHGLLTRPGTIWRGQEVRSEGSFVPKILLDHIGVGGPTQQVRSLTLAAHLVEP